MCSLMDLSFASGMRKHESMRVRESEWDGARWQRAVTGSPSKFRLATTLKVVSAAAVGDKDEEEEREQPCYCASATCLDDDR